MIIPDTEAPASFVPISALQIESWFVSAICDERPNMRTKSFNDAISVQVPVLNEARVEQFFCTFEAILELMDNAICAGASDAHLDALERCLQKRLVLGMLINLGR